MFDSDFGGVGLFIRANGTEWDVQNQSAWLWNEIQRGSSHAEENVGWDPEISNQTARVSGIRWKHWLCHVMLYVCVTAMHNMLHSYIISLCICI